MKYPTAINNDFNGWPMQTAVNLPKEETPEKTERNEQIEQLKLINKNLSMINKELHNINKTLSRR